MTDEEIQERLVPTRMVIFNANAKGIQSTGNYHGSEADIEGFTTRAVEIANTIISRQHGLTPDIQEELKNGLTQIFDAIYQRAADASNNATPALAAKYADMAVKVTNTISLLPYTI